MSHFTLLVTVDKSVLEEDLEAAVSAALAPFNENLEVPEFVKYTREQLIANERKEIEDYRDGLYATYLAEPIEYAENCHNPAHLDYLQQPAHGYDDPFAPEVSLNFADKLAMLDNDEDLYKLAVTWLEPEEINAEGGQLSTYNPDSKWDWYVIGGRWAGMLGNTADEDATDWNGVNFARRKDVAELEPTFAFLNKAGVWQERGDMGWFGMVSNEAEAEVWAQRFADNFALTESEDWLVVVDCHI